MIERIYTKEVYEEIKYKFHSVTHIAQVMIDNAKPKDILVLTISMDGKRIVEKAQVTTPDDYLKSCVI